MSTLRFADELVDVQSLNFPAATKFKKKELDMATTLVENLADEWRPEKYTDDYRGNLMRIIKAKMKGKRAHLVSEEQPRDSNVVDLMERLRRSLETSGGQKKTGRGARKAKRTPVRKRSTRRRVA